MVAFLALLMSMIGVSGAVANDLHETQQSNFSNFDYIKDAQQSTEHGLGQGFVATESFADQRVHHIAVYLQRVGTAENACVTLSLRTAFDSGEIGWKCVPATNISTGGQWVDFTFTSTIDVTSGNTYFFYVQYHGSCDTCMKMFWGNGNYYRGSAWPTTRYGRDGTGSYWQASGTDLSFLVAVDHTPVMITRPAENVTDDGARMKGSNTDDSGVGGSIYFDWGTTPSYGNTTTPFTCNAGSDCWIDWSNTFAPNTTYHYRACGTNYVGTQCGANTSFKTWGTTPTSNNFGSVTVGSSSAAVTFTVTAQSTTSLAITSITSGGSHPSDFVKQNDFCNGQTLSANATCTFQVRFAPTAVGSRSASIVVSTNAGSQTVPLSGNGLGSPAIDVTPPAINFGTVTVGSSSSPSTVTVSNPGSATLSVSSVSVGGSHPGDFPKSSDGCTGASVAPGGSCTFQVAFSPTVIGARSATVTVSSNAGTDSSALSGTGSGAPVAAVTPTNHNYGTIVVGSSSTAQTFTVQNTGNANMSVSGVAIGGANSGDFSKTSDGCSGATIAPSSSCTFSVTFTPSALGSRVATATVSTNGGNPVVNLSGTGGGAPLIDVSPPNINFGNADLGTSSSPSTVTVSNTGTAAMSITSVSIGGANAGDFGKSSDNCQGATVAAGASCTFAVTFTPTAVGSRAASVSIVSNGGNGSVALSGNGVGVPQANVTPANHSYGTITVGTTSSAQTFTVSNPGSAALSVTSVALSGTNAADFTKTSDNCSGASVAPGATCTFQVQFTPGALGARSATVTVTTNAGTRTVALSGTGGGTPAGTLSSTSHNFGTLLVGTSSSPVTFTLTSNGTSDLTVSSVSLSGANANQFSITSDTCTGATIPGGSTCTIQVTFSPTSAGAKSATVTLVTNAGNKTASLSGTAIAPGISVSPPSISFGTVVVGTSSSPSTVTVTNTGTANLSVTGVSVSGANASDFVLGSNGCTGATVAPGATCTFTVTFTPGAAGSRSATVTITSNAGNQTVALSGAGGVAAITVSPTSLNFGYVGVDPSDPQTVTVSNTGTAPLSVSTLTISGAAAGDYTVSADNCTGVTLSPGQACTFDVTLEVTVAGTRSASITIASNAGNRTVSLTGIGDLQGPTTTFTTAQNGIVLPGILGGTVTGTVTDDRSGVDTVVVTFTPLLPTGASTVQATVSCNANRRSCTWSAVAPTIPGIYTVTVQSTDLAGNIEFPGPAPLTVIV